MRQTLIFILFILVVLPFLEGCASVGVTKINDFGSKPENCGLQVFTSADEVKRPYSVACLIDSKTGSHAFADHSMAGAINNAKPRACECGADGLIVSEGRTEGASGWGQGFATLKAIRFTDH